jgi:ectoine hydroxylase-related dioxygenase (phytanoyl-CoA dioxygenase family)
MSTSSLNLGPSYKDWAADNKVTKSLRDQWISDGFVILENVYTSNNIEKYNEYLKSIRLVVDDGKDANGFGDRIGQMHQKNEELLELASSDQVINFLNWAFGDKPVVFGSLNFEKGSSQDAHVDAIFFLPEPIYSMAGVWVALEDIQQDAGPLFYLPGSHQWPFIHSEDVIEAFPELSAARNAARISGYPEAEKNSLVTLLGQKWTSLLKNQEEKINIRRVPLTIKSGDVVIWHSLLAHGGMPINNPCLTRKSVVFHYIGSKTNLYTFDQFMLNDYVDLKGLPPQPMNLKNYKGLNYMQYSYFVTYSVSGQIIHPL